MMSKSDTSRQKYCEKIKKYQRKIDEIDRRNIGQMQPVQNTTGFNFPPIHSVPILPQMPMGNFFEFSVPFFDMHNTADNVTHYKMQSYASLNGHETYNYMEKSNGQTIKQGSWERDQNGNMIRNSENPQNVRVLE